jgi:hypothetical protein
VSCPNALHCPMETLFGSAVVCSWLSSNL